MFDPYESCEDCPYRCAEPNCHNVARCPGWAARVEAAAVRKLLEKRRKDIDDYVKAKAVYIRDKRQRRSRR